MNRDDDRPVVICGGPDMETRTRTYMQLVGRRRVSVASQIAQFSGAIVDVRGGLAAKRLIPFWQEHGCTVISDGPLTRTLAQSQELLASGHLLLTFPSLYERHHRLILEQTAQEAIGEVIAVRLVWLLPGQIPLWDSIVLTHGLDALALLQALGGPVERIMVQERALKRRRPDTCVAVGRFAAGALFYLELSAACPEGYQAERIEVVGREGIIEYNSDLNRGLRVTTAAGSRLHSALHEPAVVGMLRDYLRSIDDPSAREAHQERAQATMELLFRAMESVQSHEPR